MEKNLRRSFFLNKIIDDCDFARYCLNRKNKDRRMKNLQISSLWTINCWWKINVISESFDFSRLNHRYWTNNLPAVMLVEWFDQLLLSSSFFFFTCLFLVALFSFNNGEEITSQNRSTFINVNLWRKIEQDDRFEKIHKYRRYIG